MAEVKENGILDQREFEAYKARSVQLKFRSQLFGGIGASTVFGIVGFTTSHLLGVFSAGAAGAATTAAAAATATVWWPLAVIGVMALIGIASIYMGNKYFTESMMLDQDFNAKKIGRATSVEQAKLMQQSNGREPMMFDQEVRADASEQTSWAEKIPPAAQAKSWAEKVQAQAAAEPTQGKGA